ncbi:HAD family hydrolase [soil metagenome]
MHRRAVFLDRDGVLNKAILRDGRPHPPPTVDALELLPGVASALASLRDDGFLLVVVSNQPDVARGSTTLEAVEAINDRLVQALPIDLVLVCYHDDADDCACRKPRPGLLVEGSRRLGIDLAHSYMVGDRWRDIDAGRAAGCVTVFVDYGYAERAPENPDHVVRSLSEAAAIIRQRERPTHLPTDQREVD